MTPTRRSNGEHVVLREVWRGKIWTLRPVIVVQDRPDLLALHMPHGAFWRGAETLEGETLRVPWQDWQLSAPKRWYNHALRLSVPGEPYSVDLVHTPSWRFLFWYINVEEPTRPGPHGFDYMDWTLDVVVAPDLRSHFWKDEAELEDAVGRGVYSREHALAIREAAERALAHLVAREPPFDEPWEDWRPDPEWGLPELPERCD
jgi:hypothetical protein